MSISEIDAWKQNWGEQQWICIFSFHKDFPVAFRKGFIGLYSHQCVTVPIPLHPCFYVIISVIFGFASWRAKKWHFIIVLICISLTAGRSECFFMCLRSFDHWLFELLFLICRSSLHLLDSGPFSMENEADVFFQPVTCYNFLLRFLEQLLLSNF